VFCRVSSEHNMKVLIALAVLTVVASMPTKDEQWIAFKKEFNKVYRDYGHEAERKAIFEAQLDYVEDHNRKYDEGLSTFYVGINQFSDWTDEEWRAYLTAKAPERQAEEGEIVKVSAPSAHDWRSHNAVTHVKNQGQCGSCWAFAVTGAVEGAWAKAHGHLYDLAEQQLVDCGRGSCNGGWTSGGYDTIMAKGGQDLQTCYPYTARDGYCKFDGSCAPVSITGYRNVAARDENNMRNALYSHSPLAILIDASPNSFRSYRGGVYYDPSCSQWSINHAVLAVGYDVSSSSNSQQYWLVKNSWSTSWGESGYIRMRFGVNQCNLASSVDYPTV